MTEDEIRRESTILRNEKEEIEGQIKPLKDRLDNVEQKLKLVQVGCSHCFTNYSCAICGAPDYAAGYG